MKRISLNHKGIRADYPSSEYVSQVIERAELTTSYILKELVKSHHNTINFICKGSSGIMLATMCCYFFKDTKLFPLISVCKTGEESVGGHPRAIGRQAINPNTLNIVVDDFISMGTTIGIIYAYIANSTSGLPKPKIVIDAVIVAYGVDHLNDEDLEKLNELAPTKRWVTLR